MPDTARREEFVFVSYAHPDEARVLPLVEALKARGIVVWWDRDLEPGSLWRDEIATRLDEAACVLVIWTETSVDRPFVQDEADGTLALVPVELDAAATIPLGFRSYHAADLTDWPEGAHSHEAFEGLLAVLQRYVARGAQPVDALAVKFPESGSREPLAATEELRGKVRQIRTLAELAASDARACRDLDGTLREIDKTYKTVTEAVVAFLKPAGQSGEIDAGPYLEFERDGFFDQIHGQRGHCAQITSHYIKEGGIRQWLKPHLPADRLSEADLLFHDLSRSDYTLFDRMEGIADFLRNHARAVVNLLFAGEQKKARKTLALARQTLSPLEDALAAARAELQDVRAAMGFTGHGGFSA